MATADWTRGPFGLDASKGATMRPLKRVLVVVHHLTAALRLADVTPIFEQDRRLQVVYTVAPASLLSVGAWRYLDELGTVAIPFEQAAQTTFDLAIAAGHGSLEQIHAPVVMLPHGVGPTTLINRWEGRGLRAERPVAGLRAEAVVAGGRVIPSAIAVAQDGHREAIRRACPEALPAVVVTGDPTYDRLAASAPLRSAYRSALRVGDDRRLIVVSSTWGPRSLLGRHPDLPLRLASELPADRFRVVLALHPNTWSWHGRHQVTAWYADCLRRGVRLLSPDAGWGGALVAADHLVGDHGSVSCTSAALGVPVSLAAFPDEDVLPGSTAALLGRLAPRLDPNRPLLPQLATSVPTEVGMLRERVTSVPGEAAGLLRALLYRLLELPEPDVAPVVEPYPLPGSFGRTGPAS